MTPDQTEADRAFDAWMTSMDAENTKFTAWLKREFPHGMPTHAEQVFAAKAWLAAKAEPVEVTDEMVERGAAAMKPNLFSNNEREAYFAASPTTVDHARHISRTLIARILSAALNPIPTKGSP